MNELLLLLPCCQWMNSGLWNLHIVAAGFQYTCTPDIEDWYLGAPKEREWESCRKQGPLKGISPGARGELERMNVQRGTFWEDKESCLWLSPWRKKKSPLRNLNIDFALCVSLGLKVRLPMSPITVTLRSYFHAMISLWCLAKVNANLFGKKKTQETLPYLRLLALLPRNWRWTHNSE